MAKIEDPLRAHLLELLVEGSAHAGFEKAVGELNPKYLGVKLPGVPHSAWDQLEHMRIAQADILAFTSDARHVSPKWPDEYWPTVAPTPARWKKSIAGFKADRAAFIKLVENPRTDLLEALPYGDGQTVAREAMLLADHTAYHLGQLILLRRCLGAWPEE